MQFIGVIIGSHGRRLVDRDTKTGCATKQIPGMFDIQSLFLFTCLGKRVEG